MKTTLQYIKEAQSLFDTANESNSKDRWARYMERMCVLVCPLDDAVRRKMFVEAREKRMNSDSSAKSLWFFSHPSYGAFTRFLEILEENLLLKKRIAYLDPMVYGAAHTFDERMCNFLGRDALSSKKTFLQNFIDRVAGKRRAIREEEDAFRAFSRIYWLYALSGSYQSYFPGHLPKWDNSVRDIHLIPHFSEEDDITACEIRKRKFVLADRVLQRDLFFLIARLMYHITEDTEYNLKREIAEHISIDLKSCVSFSTPYPSGFIVSPIDRIAETLQVCMKSGTWPNFFEEERPVLKHHASIRVPSYTVYIDQQEIHALVRRRIASAGFLFESILSPLHGRLSIGLKIHCVEEDIFPHNTKLFERSFFKVEESNTSFVIPPVSNMSLVHELLASCEKKTGVPFLDNKAIQLQVCSPGRLDQRNAAILGVCFYLGSDVVRRFLPDDFSTSHQSETGGFFVIYDGGNVCLEFSWWGKDGVGNLRVRTLKDAGIVGRTDVLACRSMRDIDNINLVATLLVHAQYGGFWGDLGHQFAKDVTVLLEKYQFSHLLDIPWVLPELDDIRKGRRAFRKLKEERELCKDRFFESFSKLMDYAFGEYHRISEAVEKGDAGASRQGILFEMNDVLDIYREELAVRSPTDLKRTIS